MFVVQIELRNWEKFNPRSDRANYSWFRLNNDFFDELFSLSSEQKIIYIFLLTRASKKNNPSFDLDINYASAILKLSDKTIIKQIQHLAELGVITPAESRQKAGAEPSLLPATYETNVRDETNVTRRTNTSIVLEQIQHDGGIKDQTGNPILENLLKLVKPSTQAAWLAAYPDQEWIKTELLKAHAWIDVNPKKAPKHFPRFMGNWLARGWEQYRKTLQSQNPKTAYKGIKAILDEERLEDPEYACG